MRICKLLLATGLVSGFCFLLSAHAYAVSTNNTSATNSTFTYPFTMGKITYNPLKCSTDPKGMVYFAIGRKVLRQPAKNINYIFVIFSSTDKGLYINPPNPTEPMGCHDNPIQGFSFSLFPLSYTSGVHPNILSKYVDLIGLNIGKNRRTPYDMEFSSTCNSNDFRDTSISGFIGRRKHFEECYQNLAYQSQDHYTADGKN